MSKTKGNNLPTQESRTIYERPTATECSRIRDGESPELGCPKNHGCSCAHGIEGYVCKYGIT